MKHGAKNYRHGQAHHRARYSNDRVEKARWLHDSGAARPAIAAALRVPYDTLRDWVEYRTRMHG